jgi:hypothetical protein
MRKFQLKLDNQPDAICKNQTEVLPGKVSKLHTILQSICTLQPSGKIGAIVALQSGIISNNPGFIYQ